MRWKILLSLYQNSRIVGAGLTIFKTNLIFCVLKTMNPAPTMVGLRELSFKFYVSG